MTVAENARKKSAGFVQQLRKTISSSKEVVLSLLDHKNRADSPISHRSAARTRSPVETAIVINDDEAAVTPETLVFLLRGIFQDEASIQRARAMLPQDTSGLTFREIELKLEGFLIAEAKRSDSPLISKMCLAFSDHRQVTNSNRTAYSVANRVNPSAVFWPNPTDPDRPRSLYDELPFAKPIPLIDKSTRIVSAGSCFATELAHSLQTNGYNYVIKEQNKGKPGSYEFLGHATGLPASSAAWGVIFNTPSFRQLVEKAFGVRALPKILWTQEYEGKLRYLDPFRENIGFETPEAYEANHQEHLDAARAAFLEMEVFVITLGLNEVWYFRADGSVFSRSPWKTAPSLIGHRVMTVQENVDDLVRMREILKAYNPGVEIICTLSPIALHATFRGDNEHVVTANGHSKAVLRVAAEEFSRRFSDVHYFPSYETVTTSTERPWTADQRHVSEAAVKNVMGLFHQMFGK
jgi:hypothetical protein